MDIVQFKEEHNIESTIDLKDGRKLHTTKNGFVYWVESKKGKVDQITEQQYNNSKRHRITKKNR